MEPAGLPELFSGLDQAIARGLAYLHQHQMPNGEFCLYCARDIPMLGWCEPDSSIFPTVLIANNLLSLAESPQTEEMLTRVTKFVLSQSDRGGLWSHVTARNTLRHLCPPDADDTACALDLLRERGIACPNPKIISVLLSNRNGHGLFYTWFLLRLGMNRNLDYWRITLAEFRRPLRSLAFWRMGEATRRAVDGVVNANVLYYLGERPETSPIIDFLLRIIDEKRETDCDLYYRDAHIVYYFFSRNYHRGITRLEPARQPMIDRIVAAAKPDGRLGETVIETATAVCALLNLRAAPPELGRAIDFLLRAQCATGEWPRWSFYYGGPSRRVSWGSEELTTGFCLEALARYRALAGRC